MPRGEERTLMPSEAFFWLGWGLELGRGRTPARYTLCLSPGVLSDCCRDPCLVSCASLPRRRLHVGVFFFLLVLKGINKSSCL